MDEIVRSVLARYPAPLGAARAEPLGNRGGFSGARLWRVHGAGAAWCLRGAPATEARPHLVWRHALMGRARAAGLRFVPAVLAADGGATCVEAGGRCWELQEWLPGRADYRDAPSVERLRAAARALASVHRAWEALAEPVASPVPAVQRRLEAAASPPPPPGPERARHPLLGPLLLRARELLRAWLPRVPGMLGAWAGRRGRLQPCLRDVWHDHLLFEGESLAGLVDYAAVRPDEVATDVARLVGSLAGDDEGGWRTALTAYREVRALSGEREELARALDRTGAVVALATWARWLAERSFEDEGQVERRLGELVRRVEGW